MTSKKKKLITYPHQLLNQVLPDVNALRVGSLWQAGTDTCVECKETENGCQIDTHNDIKVAILHKRKFQH
jgi:hypothetical protein